MFTFKNFFGFLLIVVFVMSAMLTSAAKAQDEIKCIVVFEEDAAEDAIENYIAFWEAEGVSVVYSLDLINGIVVAVPDFITCPELAADPIVVSVEEDQQIESERITAAGEGGSGEGGSGEGGSGEGGSGEGGSGEGDSGEGDSGESEARAYFEFFLPIFESISNYERTWGVLSLYRCAYEEDFYTSAYDPKCQSRLLSEALLKLKKRYLEGKPVRVAVFDTGIDVVHPAFAGRVIESIDFVHDCLNFAPAWLNLMDDCNGHGTHVAGTLGADIVGAAPHAEILSIKVLRRDTSGELSTLLAGLHWIMEWMEIYGPIDVINMSLAFKKNNILVRRLLEMALEKGVAVVASVGNHYNWEEEEQDNWEEEEQDLQGDYQLSATGEGSSGEGGSGKDVEGSCNVLSKTCHPVMYPAKYSASSSVIAVTATDPEGEVAPFANTGPEVDICAPGVDVLSTIPGGEFYGVASGTSMAAPHVSAAVALMRAVNPDLTPESIKRILRKTASGCQLNLDRALRMAHVLSLRGPKMSLRGPKR
jgi:hypothetical protein